MSSLVNNKGDTVMNENYQNPEFAMNAVDEAEELNYADYEIANDIAMLLNKY